MKDIVIAAGVIGLLYLVVKRSGTALVPTQTPAPPVPLAPRIGGQVVIGDSYGVPPWGAILGTPGIFSPTPLPSTVPYPTALPPPGGVSGGIASGAAAGGGPLGSALTPGVSTGTGTSNNAFGIGTPTARAFYVDSNGTVVFQ